MSEDLTRLIATATRARELAYCPYSDFAVGVALETITGKVYSGCNVENASLGLTICAERGAACAAVADGQREWKRIVLVTKNAITPCGACRQFLAEFAPQLDVIMVDAETSEIRSSFVLDALLPERFENFKDV